MPDNPVVSVCIATFQHAPYIEQCIESALMQQTNFPFEILLGEDESTDGTREICKAYAEKYPGKIRLFLRSRKDVIYINGNPTGRFNAIQNFLEAKGKYIALLEGDDYWSDPLKLQKQFDILETHPEIIVCHHWQKIASLNASGEYEETKAPTEGQGYYPETIATVREIFENRLRIKSRTMFFRNIFLDGYKLPDWYFKLQFGDVPLCMIFGKFGNFYFLDEEMAVYRITAKGVAGTGRKNFLFTFNHFTEWIRIWEQGNIFFNREYEKETLRTIAYFYTVILERYNYSFTIFRMCTKNVMFKSKLTHMSRMRILSGLYGKATAGRLKRIFNK